MTDLKPCPFCGYTKIFLSCVDGLGWYNEYSLVCEECPCEIVKSFHISCCEEEVLCEMHKIWNKRYTEQDSG